MDVYRFSWWKYLIDAPSAGFDYLLQARYTPNRKTDFYAVYHEEHKEKNRPGGGKVKEIVGTTRRTMALNADYVPVRGLSLRSRVQWGGFAYQDRSASRGFALVQDATLDIGRLSLNGRVALFGTDDYDSRQYVYERDVLYAFSFPAYFNRAGGGTRGVNRNPDHLLPHFAGGLRQSTGNGRFQSFEVIEWVLPELRLGRVTVKSLFPAGVFVNMGAQGLPRVRIDQQRPH